MIHNTRDNTHTRGASLPQHIECLQRQLARGRYDERAKAVNGAPAGAVEGFEEGDEEGEGFARAW